MFQLRLLTVFSASAGLTVFRLSAETVSAAVGTQNHPAHRCRSRQFLGVQTIFCPNIAEMETVLAKYFKLDQNVFNSISCNLTWTSEGGLGLL